MDYEWLRHMLTSSINEITQAADPVTEGEKIETLYQQVKHRFMEKTSEMFSRMQKTMLMSIDREREEVE